MLKKEITVLYSIWKMPKVSPRIYVQEKNPYHFSDTLKMHEL